MRPLVVQARLTGAGFASGDRWSPAIDALLGYWAMRERLGVEEAAARAADTSRLEPVEGLPLEVVRWREWWWYACSTPVYEQAAERQKHFHRRFDDGLAARYGPEGLKRVATSAGPYKSARLTATVRVTRLLTWHVVGDQPEIERLLRRCHWIGAKHAQGHGRVLGWEVRESETPEETRNAAYTHRPLPVEYASERGLGGPILWWGVRPPGRLPANQTLCVMPAGKEGI